MKSQGINCKDIGIIMGGKDKEVVRTRYKELMDAKDKENAAAGASESKEKKSKEKKVKEGKQKEEKRKDGKHKEDKGKGKEPKDNELKGILKNGKDKAEHKSKKKEEGSNGSPTIINVMIGDDDELNKDDVSHSIPTYTPLLTSSFVARKHLPHERALWPQEVDGIVFEALRQDWKARWPWRFGA